jgi:hypothetical protein
MPIDQRTLSAPAKSARSVAQTKHYCDAVGLLSAGSRGAGCPHDDDMPDFEGKPAGSMT